MATLDGGGVADPGGEEHRYALDGGQVSEAGPIPTENPYGVTVQQVRQLASHVGFDPAQGDPEFGPLRRQITDDAIQHWINLVTSSVAARSASLARFQDQTDRWAVISGSAQTAITNGAASYVVAAAFPEEEGGLAADLRARYEAELGSLLSLGEAFDGVDVSTGTVTPGVSPVASYTPPSVPRGSGFFATDPYNTVPYYDPNRMNPRTGGYPAPGAEGQGYRR